MTPDNDEPDQAYPYPGHTSLGHARLRPSWPYLPWPHQTATILAILHLAKPDTTTPTLANSDMKGLEDNKQQGWGVSEELAKRGSSSEYFF